jgi:hypothetical protein
MPRMLLTLFCLLASLPVHARDWSVSITDYTGRGFPADLVTYGLPAGAAPTRVVGPDGQAAPVQVQGTTVSFLANLPANATVTYTLSDGAPVDSAVSAPPEGARLVLASPRFSRLRASVTGVRAGKAKR